MRPVVLCLDDAFDSQPSLVTDVLLKSGGRVEARDLGPQLRLWSRPAALNALRTRLSATVPTFGPELVFAGSGDFHHITPILLERALTAAGCGDVTVLHFDNHPDWAPFGDGLHCGSWITTAASLPEVRRFISVGLCSPDIVRPGPKPEDLALVEAGILEVYPYRTPDGDDAFSLADKRWPTVESLGAQGFSDLLMSRIETDAVYITIDKDVLRPEDAYTNWDQGQTRLDDLEVLIERIAGRHEIIGADVVGDWSKPRYGGGLIDVGMKHGEALLDQPWLAPDAPSAALRNEVVNRRLLKLFA